MSERSSADVRCAATNCDTSFRGGRAVLLPGAWRPRRLRPLLSPIGDVEVGVIETTAEDEKEASGRRDDLVSRQQVNARRKHGADAHGANRDRTGDLLLANWADIVAVGRHWASMAEPTGLSGGGGTRWWHLFSVRTWSLLGPKHFFLSPLNRSGEVPASGGMQERAGSRAGCRSSSRGRA